MFGRRVAEDPRDAAYPIRALMAAEPRSRRVERMWRDSGWWGDQGATSQCVAYSWTHWLEDGPVAQPGKGPIVQPAEVYAEAQKIDEWPGEDYDGTSVRAGAKVLQARGFIASYHWALTIDDIIQAVLEKGPVVVGTAWYEGMMAPSGGFLELSGQMLGGHAYVLNGVNRRRGLFRVKNSWGREWALQGRAYLGIDDMEWLLKDQGEACLAVEIART